MLSWLVGCLGCLFIDIVLCITIDRNQPDRCSLTFLMCSPMPFCRILAGSSRQCCMVRRHCLHMYSSRSTRNLWFRLSRCLLEFLFNCASLTRIMNTWILLGTRKKSKVNPKSTCIGWIGGNPCRLSYVLMGSRCQRSLFGDFIFPG